MAEATDQKTESFSEARKIICRTCPHSWAKNKICGICKCWLPFKRRLSFTKCPDDPPRWNPEKP